MMSTAVKVLVIEPIMYCVSSPGATAPSTRAEPTWPDQTSRPSRTTPALTAGERQSRWAARSRRSSSRTTPADRSPVGGAHSDGRRLIGP